MKKTFLFSLSLIFCSLSLLTSCSDDNDDDKYLTGPKDDIEFKGKSLEEVQKALQGTWLPIYSINSINSTGTVTYVHMIIKGNRIKTNKWYDIVWIKESVMPDGDEMHAFSPKYDNWEYTNSTFIVPFCIKDGILTLGNSLNNPGNNTYYKCITEENYIDY